MSKNTKNFEVPIDEQRVVRASVDEPMNPTSRSKVIVFIPGFKGFKDWGGWPWFCGELAKAGHRVHRLNPSMCGVGPSLDSFDEPERFAQQTLGHDVEDLETFLLRPEVGSDEVILLGHSRGGIVAALTAAASSQVAGVITMGTPDALLRLSDEEMEEWQSRGKREIVNARTGEVLYQHLAVLEDYLDQEDIYNAPEALAKAAVPVLAIHGEADPSVESSCASRLLEDVDSDLARKVLIAGAGHTFGMVHPFSDPSPHAEQVLEVITDWLQEKWPR
jgi:pimeloyl-ACP methyl ester carboxylesterase